MQVSRCYHRDMDTPHLQASLAATVADPRDTISILACHRPFDRREVGMSCWSGESGDGHRRGRSLSVPVDLQCLDKKDL